jgi:hypothetical protein
MKDELHAQDVGEVRNRPKSVSGVDVRDPEKDDDEQEEHACVR